MMQKKTPNWRKILANTNHYAKIYKIAYEKVGQLPVSEEYILDCYSVLYYFQEKLVGGYILNNGQNQPLRYFSILRHEEEVDLLLDTENLSEKHLMEITCIFLDKKIAPIYRVLFYIEVLTKTYKFARKSKKIGILGGSFEKKIQLMQQKLMPYVILKTVINKSLKIKGHPKGLVMLYYCPTKQFILRAISVILQYSFQKIFRY